MNVDMMKSQGLLLMECVTGSHMYGIALPTSDKDVRGIYRYSPKQLVRLFPYPGEVSKDKQDTKYYELRRFLELMLSANPTVIEMLWVPDDCLLFTSLVYSKLLTHRRMFLTKKSYWSHTGLAIAQIKKARGKNKKVNYVGDYVDENGMKLLKASLVDGDITREWLEARFCKPFALYLADGTSVPTSVSTDWKAMDEILEIAIQNGHFKMVMDRPVLRGPRREEFMWVIDRYGFDEELSDLKCPARPLRLEDWTDITDLRGVELAKQEHLPDTYRIYWKEGAPSPIVDGRLVCSSIPETEEWDSFAGLLIYNQHEYEKARGEYKSFWEWMLNRNEARWTDQEEGLLDYDTKNAAHTIRPLLSLTSILQGGDPIVRFTGAQQKLLMDLRLGKFTYEEFISMAETMLKELEHLYAITALPDQVNTAAAEELYQELAWAE